MERDDLIAEQPPAATAEDSSVISADVVREVVDALRREDTDFVRRLVGEFHAADQADLIEQLSHRMRLLLLDAIRDMLAAEALPELGEAVRDDVIEHLEPEELAAAITELDADDAAYVLEDLNEGDRREVLDSVPDEERAEVEAALGFPEDSAGRLMQRDFIAIPSYWTVGQAIDYMRDTDDLPEDFYEIFVVDPRMKPVGSVPLNRFMRAKRPVVIEEIMRPDPILIDANADQEDVAFQFGQYNLVSALVVDSEKRLLGVIMVDDIVDVIREEAEEDIMLLGGVSEGGVHESTLRTTRDRFVWLLANLATAILASLVIAQFDASIEQMVALAILMPIVASMGGNAGTQTLTVAVRALGMKELTASNMLRTVGRELMVGGINGLLFAAIMGVATALWFQNWPLGGVIGAAMIINMIVAALAGILVPIGLSRAGVDPAVASSVFVTTVTDVIGFLAFLGLAALVLL
ncbi:MAG: magnesium transporter [Alphaproteobacteria bacterium]